MTKQYHYTFTTEDVDHMSELITEYRDMYPSNEPLFRTDQITAELEHNILYNGSIWTTELMATAEEAHQLGNIIRTAHLPIFIS